MKLATESTVVILFRPLWSRQASRTPQEGDREEEEGRRGLQMVTTTREPPTPRKRIKRTKRMRSKEEEEEQDALISRWFDDVSVY